MEEKKLNDEKLEAVTGGEMKMPNALNANVTTTGDTNFVGVTRTCANCKNYGSPLCPNETQGGIGKKYSAESCSFFIAKA